ncbi:TPA: hypothetical protein NHT88_002386 [Providencia rettgeri]|nr:hypothetical protein [Providencia rettgeri]
MSTIVDDENVEMAMFANSQITNLFGREYWRIFGYGNKGSSQKTENKAR